MNTHPDTASDPAAGAPLERRHLISALLAGAVASVPFGRHVSADDSTTTTAPPRRDGADIAVLSAALDVERSLVALYFATFDRGGLSDDESAVILAVHDHHKAYVDVLVGYLGPDASPDPQTSRTAPAGAFAAVAAQLAAAEADAVASHLSAIGALRGIEAAALLASIVSTEARHQTVMSILAGQPATTATA